MAISLLQMSMMGISSVLNEISISFPNEKISTIQLLAVLPDLFIVVSTICVGRILSKISKRNILLFSSVLFILTSIGGMFFHNDINSLLITSGILGVAIGTMMPTVASLIDDTYNGEEKEKVLGIQSSVVGIGGVLISIIAILLASARYYNAYLIYLWGIPCAILSVLFIKVRKDDKRKRNPINIKWTVFYALYA
ncbi:MAG: MFS transporter, partial [Holdemanella sp.]|nr:MFS transporter [Holdemanella sp.]